ncbi:hypothetical protein GCM10019998_19610 [Tetragenococcus solitarius]|uniref:Uncharacterized protein n=1 Tax=Tetragenococcus solitarius TaxID=71453 RepID=A0ABN3Y9C0_9ENTE
MTFSLLFSVAYETNYFIYPSLFSFFSQKKALKLASAPLFLSIKFYKVGFFSQNSKDKNDLLVINK